MKDDNVIVIRTKDNEDIVAKLNYVNDDMVKIESPHFIEFSQTSGKFVLIPYCIFSDEKFFEFKRNDLKFLVTANETLAIEYLLILDEIEEFKLNQINNVEELEQALDEIESNMFHLVSKLKH